MSNRAWVTLATNDSYGLGALVLAHSLRRVGSAYPAVVLITPSVTEAMRDRLRAVFVDVVTVDVLDSRDAAHLALLQRPELGITFTKINCWNLTQYEKCVFLDADALVVQNCDELFEREELSAAPDVGWPDCFNSGVFVYTPSADTFNRLLQFAQERGSFDGGDQGLLNSFFSDWAHGDISKHLPFLYNVTSAAFYSYIPALKHYGQNLKIIHFIGAAKPWLQHFNWESRAVDAPEHLRQFLQLWWDLFVADVHAQLDVSMVDVEAPHHEPTNEQPPLLPPDDVRQHFHYQPILDSNSEFHWHWPDDKINKDTRDQPLMLAPEEVSQHFHYQPILDPQSEFPWHWPDDKIKKDIQEQQIDMSDIFDPWEIYGGHIPPNPEVLTGHQSEGKSTNQADLRKYVWEYYNQVQTLDKNPHVQNTHNDQTQQWSDRQIDSYQHSPDPACIYVYNQTTHSQNDTQREVQYEHQKHFHSYQEETGKQTYNDIERLPEQNHCHQEVLYNSDFPKEYSQQQAANEYSINTEHYDNLDHYPNNNHSNFHKHKNDFQNQSYIHKETSYNDYFNHSQTQHFYSHQSEPNYCIIEATQTHTEQIHEINDQNNSNRHSLSNNVDSHTSATHHYQSVEVKNVCVEHGTKINHHYRKENINNVPIADENINGDASKAEDELEDIIPRHPYDGFYLRHRVTIDSRGRKICTHEIPQIPSSSTSECSEPQDYFSADETPLSDFEDQSGVAGNFARVTLGSSQREAIDELTRRQGWEAGNIDYMGVDSFDNIWAKISQTLSQARPSPPKQSPPRDSVPPANVPEQVEVQIGEVARESTTEVIEVAKEVVPTEEPIQVQDPNVITPVVSAETAAPPTQVTEQVESVVQSETVAATETHPSSPTIEGDVTAEVSASASIPAAEDVSSTIQTQLVSEVPVETLPLTTAEPVTESVTLIEPPALTEEPTIAAVIVPAEKAVEQTPIPEAPVSKESPVTVADTVTAEITPQASEVIVPSAIIEEPVSVIPTITSDKIPGADSTSEVVAPVLSECKEKVEEPVIETSPVEPVVDTVKVPSTVTKSESEPVQAEIKEKTEAPVSDTTPLEPVAEPIKVPSADIAPVAEPTPTEAKEKTESPITATAPVEPVAETQKVEDPVQAAPALPAEPSVCPTESTPEKSVASDSASDSPPLANTPSKEEIPDVSAAKSAERRKPAGKLQLSPPVAPDPLPTPDSELEDAAALAQSIIASELRTPTVTSPGSTTSPTSPPAPLQHSRLSVDEPEVPTPPVGAVSLAQIGVKTKGKTSTAAQIESSVSEKPESAASTPAEPAAKKTETAPAEVPKKKVVKKVVKKASGAVGETPVPPPRKKEKKPKE